MHPTDPRPATARHRRDGAAREDASAPGRRVRPDVAPPPVDETDHCHCPAGFHEYGVHAPGFGPRQLQPLVPLPGVFRIDDLAELSRGEAAALLRRAEADAARYDVHCPHILITRDRYRGAVSHAGPFGSGSEALAVAHQYLVQHQVVDLQSTYSLTIAPLFDLSAPADRPDRIWWRRRRP